MADEHRGNEPGQPDRHSNESGGSNDRFSPEQLPNDGWDPDAVLETAAIEAATLELDELEMTHRVFKENAVGAALSITHLARNSTNEKIRLEAAKYVIDRNLGKIVDPIRAAQANKAANEPDTFEEFLSGLTVSDESAEAAAAKVRADQSLKAEEA